MRRRRIAGPTGGDSERQFGNQRREVLAAGFLDQLFGGLGVEVNELLDHGARPVGEAGTVAGQPELVPGDGVHRLQFDGFVERRNCLLVFAERCMGEPEAVPGTVKAGPETRGFAEGNDGVARLAGMFAHVAEVEMRLRVLGNELQRLEEPLLGDLVALLLRRDEGEVPGGLDVGRVRAKGEFVLGEGGVLATAKVKQPATGIMSPTFEIHRFTRF